MTDCCSPQNMLMGSASFTCPKCNTEGKTVPIVTLKSLLVSEALEKLDVNTSYRMCMDEECPVVYFNERADVYVAHDLKVQVFQKSSDPNRPVCYCFGWTVEKIRSEIIQTGNSTAAETISEHIKAGRCGCNVNNPQGSCCLSNVKRVVDTLKG